MVKLEIDVQLLATTFFLFCYPPPLHTQDVEYVGTWRGTCGRAWCLCRWPRTRAAPAPGPEARV